MAIAGLRGTGDWGTDERPKNFRETILFLDPNGQAPLTALMARMATESVDDPEFSWWEESQDLVRLQVNGGLLDSDTTIVVDNGSGAFALVAGDLLLVEDSTGQGEILEVSANPTVDTQFTATRGAAGSTAAAIADDAWLTKIGNVFAEGTASPKATTRNPTKLNNFTQIFKTTYEITGTAEQTRLRTGDPVRTDKKRKMFDHARDLELALIFGRAFETVGSNGKPKRYTAGLNNFITTNRKVFNADWTEDNFIDSVAPVFDWDGAGAGNERVMFCGNQFLTELNKLARDQGATRINFDGVVRTYGMELQRWILPQGRVFLRTHPLLNIHAEFQKSAFVINPRGIIYRPMRGRDTKFKDDIQNRDEDVRKGQWMTEAGLEVHHEKTFAYLGNAGG